MLDSVTKKRIDDLRDILVGKTPSPQSQVEQITTGLIYKFMYDMDIEAAEMGGVPSFFVGDYEKYSWKHLFDPKLGGADKVQLYSDAIENMYTNPNAPPLFREIFKNSFLPFKDPSTLNMFLKGINEFHYSHSEKLGDAFEYLLSFMGSQGDAGQFRTPRHIISFIVEIVNPQKNESILDPACGTAGFLISSYKHILTQNTDKKIGGKLNAAERKKVGDNLVGYDISPDMTRISLVNMYLHQFKSPLIHEYDTLSSEDRWNEYYDVILANPPFFSPTGGIQPHSRFGVQSTRAEVLFVDYIMEHLKPTGRAGIVVPEGIIFQTGTAYKTLRKKLVEDCLVGVISLPAGVFQPYSGVKTSILILDKELNQKSESIFFAKVENDGFVLGKQRTPISKNDLPNVIGRYAEFLSGNFSLDECVEKKPILETSDYSLSAGKYLANSAMLNSEHPVKTLREICEITMGQSPSSDFYNENGEGLEFHQGKTNFGNIQLQPSGVYASQYNKVADENSILMSVRAPVGPVNITDRKIALGRGLCGIKGNEDCDQMYLFYLLQSSKEKLMQFSHGSTFDSINRNQLLDFEIPLPPIEVQQQIVEELEGYQKIIDGCRQVVENYKSTIDIDPSWEMIALGELTSLKYGLGESAEEQGTHRFVRITDINEFGLLRPNDKKYVSIDGSQHEYILNKGDVLMARTGATYGKCLYFEDDEPSVFAGYLIKISLIKRVLPKFFWIFSQSINFDVQKRQLVVGGGQPQFNANTLKNVIVPVPPIEDQERIIREVIVQQKIVEGNQTLLDSFQTKIKDRISKVWGE